MNTHTFVIGGLSLAGKTDLFYVYFSQIIFLNGCCDVVIVIFAKIYFLHWALICM